MDGGTTLTLFFGMDGWDLAVEVAEGEVCTSRRGRETNIAMIYDATRANFYLKRPLHTFSAYVCVFYEGGLCACHVNGLTRDVGHVLDP